MENEKRTDQAWCQPLPVGRPMKMARSMADTYDHEPWSNGSTIEDAAKHFCRSGTIDDVRHKAEELGLAYKRRDGQ
jgi:hypothetical protein